ncbi:MAG: hemolysin family protein [Eubacterium sp.]|nr:hemolysin family protein [Eubacterium sp.]MCM1214345.1 hemolysin family protein [Lachnospiraceae bacterium]MCM1305138.1 hemolysin family protein [Butyrivibrio sp.]MCM1344383.1 hemolysin family protein [Muribaculaceae bacterium]MCM1238637.1 hemolysin family protein [Lachnospiraceae bacterium]
MDDDGPTASIIIFIVLLFVDMFFYGFGAAITALNAKEVERRAQEDKDRRSLRLQKIIGDPTEYVNTVQLITTLINVILGAVHLSTMLGAMSRWLSTLAERQQKLESMPAEAILILAAVLSTLLLLYIVLTLGVLLPKKVAARVPERWAYACITPVFFVTRILSPFTGLVTVTTGAILRLFGIRDRSGETDVTEEEIINMVNEGHEQGVIQASEAEMITNIFELGDKEAQDIMTHRKNVVAIDAKTVLSDAIMFMLEGKNSRYPVYEENIDHIIGILHLKDAMRFHADGDKLNCPLRELEGLMREPYFVPQTKNINELFREMQADKLQMVIVVDEYGQTDGLLAMEDILEEIVGNILDEYDEDREYIEDKGNDEYVTEGKTPLEELEERFGISFDDEEFETLNGFLISRLDRIPEPDEQFDVDYKGYNFKILSVENKMIKSVLVTKLPEERAEEESAPERVPVKEEESALEESGKK